MEGGTACWPNLQLDGIWEEISVVGGDRVVDPSLMVDHRRLGHELSAARQHLGVITDLHHWRWGYELCWREFLDQIYSSMMSERRLRWQEAISSQISIVTDLHHLRCGHELRWHQFPVIAATRKLNEREDVVASYAYTSFWWLQQRNDRTGVRRERGSLRGLS